MRNESNDGRKGREGGEMKGKKIYRGFGKEGKKIGTKRNDRKRMKRRKYRDKK